MWAFRGHAQIVALLWWSFVLLNTLSGGEGLSWSSSDDPALREGMGNGVLN